MEVENIVKSIETNTFNDSNEQYSDACNHIARATNAYIALSLNLDSENVNLFYYLFYKCQILNIYIYI